MSEIILSFEDFDVCIEHSTRILDCIAKYMPVHANTSWSTSVLRDVILDALKTMHAQVVDRMLMCFTLNHRWDIKSGQFNGYVDTVMLAKDIDEIMDSLHST